MPVIILLLIILFLVINVPDFLNDDLTSILILFNLASCIDTGLITFAQVMPSLTFLRMKLFNFFAFLSLFGSVV